MGFIITNLGARVEKAVRFYNIRSRRTSMPSPGPGYPAPGMHPTRSGWPFVLAYNLGNFLRRLALPGEVSHRSLRSVRLKLKKTGARIGCHARMTVFQMAEVAVPGELFAEVLARIRSLPYLRPEAASNER
ncbi:MAG: transposase [Actinomycetota bacterium]|nr:transposase [Actinomycetota bacterium]